MTAGGTSIASITEDEDPKQLAAAAQAGSVQPLRAEAVAVASGTLAEATADTIAGDHGTGDAGTAVVPQRSRHTGSDAHDGAAALEAGSAVVAAAARRTSVGLADQGSTAALVQGGPDERLGRVRAGQGSVTEVLTPERNAALLKVH